MTRALGVNASGELRPRPRLTAPLPLSLSLRLWVPEAELPSRERGDAVLCEHGDERAVGDLRALQGPPLHAPCSAASASGFARLEPTLFGTSPHNVLRKYPHRLKRDELLGVDRRWMACPRRPTHTLTHSLTLMHTHTHSLSLSLAYSLSLTHTPSLRHSLSLSHTPARKAAGYQDARQQLATG